MRVTAVRPALAAALAVAVAATGCSSGRPGARRSSAPAASPDSPGPSGSLAPSATAAPVPTLAPLPVKPGPPRLALVGTFDNPVYVTSPPGDKRVFVVEQSGKVRIVSGGRVLPAPFADLTADVRFAGEQGLLSVAFAPDYPTSHLLYAVYNADDGDVRVVELRAGRDPNRVDPSTRRELIRIPKPYPNHNGGLALFDRAGMLVVGTGDGGSGNDPENRAQNLGALQGKLLRIDPRPQGGRPYGIPADNPFVRRAGARPEVWGYGLRNPWRFAFDRDTGDLYVADVGQGDEEEVDVVAPGRQSGANYGWRVFEGRRRNIPGRLTTTDRLVTPVHTYGHDGGGCTIIGGVVYRGSVGALRGRYLFGDYCSGELWSFPAGRADRPHASRLNLHVPSLTSFGVDAYGEAYVTSQGGEVWRITA